MSTDEARFFMDIFLKVALQAAHRGGQEILRHIHLSYSIAVKSTPVDLVTDADLASEKAISLMISEHFPSHQILGEESVKPVDWNDYLWIVDPLDGTTNFTHGMPFFCVSLALSYRGEVLVGVIYNPISKECFWARKGEGAWLNGAPIHVSKTEELQKSLLATGFAYDKSIREKNNYREFSYLTNLTQGVRRCGAAALDLAYVACGRFDGYWESGIKAWDIAAGSLLVAEAGGKITNYKGGPLNLLEEELIASNGHLHLPLAEALKDAKNYQL